MALAVSLVPPPTATLCRNFSERTRFMKKEKNAEISSTNLYTNIVDIQNNAIITRDNLAISVYELSPVNADLLTSNEQIEFVSNLTGCLATIRVPYKVLAVPRPFDIQPYLDELEEQRRTADDDVSKHIISEEIAELSRMVASGSIVEKFFISLFGIMLMMTTQKAVMKSSSPGKTAKSQHSSLSVQDCCSSSILSLIHQLRLPMTLSLMLFYRR